MSEWVRNEREREGADAYGHICVQSERDKDRKVGGGGGGERRLTCLFVGWLLNVPETG